MSISQQAGRFFWRWLRCAWGERQRGDTRRRGVLAALLGLATAWTGFLAHPVAEPLDALAFDAQVAAVRRLYARAASNGDSVVVVGIDEASLASLGVPLAMVHGALGTALEAIAAAAPAAIGLDIALPQVSFDPLLPGLDRELMRGMLAARARSPLVIALDPDAAGRVRVPWPPLLAAAGGGPAFGLPLFPVDDDGVIRRYDPDPGGAGAAPSARVVPLFAGRLAQVLGRGEQLARPGWIDYTRGPAFGYVPLHEVLTLARRRDEQGLRAQFAGRVVLIGSVLPYLDRLRIPAELAAWERPGTPSPGVVLNAQVMRNALGRGLVRAAPGAAQLTLLLILVGAAALGSPAWRLIRLVSVLGLGALGAIALHACGWFLAPGTALVSAGLAGAGRTALDLVGARRERERLARVFGGYVSPQLLDAILEDRILAGSGLHAAALLFADLRGFTAWSESAPPTAVRDALNRYYALATPILHAHGGTIDNFRGDGIMVIFGAPKPGADVCDAAFAAARELLQAIANFNREQTRPPGVPPMELAIGLAFGEVLVGDLGSPDRKDFTALGDAVNVAARLQDLGKELGYPVMMTRAFAAELVSSANCGLLDLGLQALRGHTPVAVCAWSGAATIDEAAITVNPGHGAVP